MDFIIKGHEKIKPEKDTVEVWQTIYKDGKEERKLVTYKQDVANVLINKNYDTKCYEKRRKYFTGL